jgi:hypothetical protein
MGPRLRAPCGRVWGGDGARLDRICWEFCPGARARTVCINWHFVFELNEVIEERSCGFGSCLIGSVRLALKITNWKQVRMARYKLHCCGGSGNSCKVALYLNCAGLDWEPLGVDLAGGQTRDAMWRAEINAMGEVPVLEVAGERMSRSGAISMWLTETVGKFAPAYDERFEAMRAA